MIHLLKQRFDRFKEIENLVSQPEVISDSARYSSLLKEHGGLIPQAQLYERFASAKADFDGAQEILADPSADDEMREMANLEVAEIQPKLDEYQNEAQEMLLLDDELSSRTVIVEIRAGTGGDEASLFAQDLFELYNHYCAWHNLKIELMDRVESELGGVKSLVFRVAGQDAGKWFRYEGGTHRVQRVPATESQGRIHTSAATVAVLPEPEEVEIQINEQDLEISAARSGGPGGQNVNKVASKCVILHKPSGIQIMSQETKSFHQNKERGIALLRAKLYEVERMRIEGERSDARASMIGSGDRSEKIRTYNWPQGRCSDHRCKVTITLDAALAGKLDEIITGMRKLEVAQKLKYMESQIS